MLFTPSRLFSIELARSWTANTLVYVKEKECFRENPRCAVRKDEKGVNKVLAVGKEAKIDAGRTREILPQFVL
jgi:rod shape-determining protein MreB